MPNERGFVTPLLAGIHLPRRAASLASPETDPDPDEIAEPRTAAIWSVYHNPQILTLDTDVAARVVDHITQTASFDSIVQAVRKAGPALTPELAMQNNAGWIVGEYVLDGKGEKIQKTTLKGEPVTHDGAPVYVYRWVLDKDVEAATTVVVAQTLERFHNDADLEGVKYLTRRGVGAARGDASLAGVQGGLLGDEKEDFDFIFHDQGLERGRRSFKVERKSADAFTLEVTNPNSIGCFVGMRAFDAHGTQLDDQLLGYVQGTFYPSLSALSGPSTGLFSVTIPKGAAKIDLFSAAIATNGGDLNASASKPAIVGEGLNEIAGVFLTSGLMDFFMPVTLR